MRIACLQVEDEPGSGALADHIHKEVGDGKQPDVGAGQHVTGQGLDHGWLFLICNIATFDSASLMPGLACYKQSSITQFGQADQSQEDMQNCVLTFETMKALCQSLPDNGK